MEIREPQNTADESKFINADRLQELGIAEMGEDVFAVFRRVADSLAKIDASHTGIEFGEPFRSDVLEMMQERKFIPSTSILMNAGRMVEDPLSACAVPPVDLRGNLSKIKQTVDEYHLSGMGTGFNLDGIKSGKNVIEIIEYLNAIGVEGQRNERQFRPVGNIAVLSIDNPALTDFINIKNDQPEKKWVFNFSVLIDDDNAEKIKKEEKIKRIDKKAVSSLELISKISESIYFSGEPGIVFVDRLNEDNQVPSMGAYESVAPCGEVGLVKGETCQFSYINLGSFVEGGAINYSELEKVARAAVRFLDDVVDYNILRYKDGLNKEVAQKRRKIGVGVCGFNDLLGKLGVNYASQEARQLGEDILSFINFISKKESVELAKDRGPFGAFDKSKYTTDESIILKKYSKQETRKVSSADWQDLDREIKKHGIRNCSTISLPPTGRSSRIIGASPSMEPDFKKILEIPIDDQLKMVSSLQKFTDESISYTINVPESTSPDSIKDIILWAVDSNLKGLTIYRDKSRQSQPEQI